jgi:hypothetical protein
MIHSPEPPTTSIAADLATVREALKRLRRQTRRWVWIESLGLLALWVAAAFWLSLLIDRLLEPPWQVRVAMLIAAGAVVGWLVATKLVGRLTAPLDDAQLALLVERSHPQFRDSLSTAVELSRGRRDDVSDALLARTAAAAAGRLEAFDPAAIFRRRSLGGLAVAATLAVASIAGLVLSQPQAAGLWARRMVWLVDEPWPRRVRLEAEGFVDGVRVVARGTDVEVLVRASSRDALPDVVDLRSRGIGPQGRGWRTDRMGTRGAATAAGQTFGHVIKGVNESLDLEIRGGDARLRPLRLEVVDAPGLESLSIVTTLPEYLGGGSRPAATSRVVPVPRGSSVDITGTATAPLTAAEVAVVEEGAETVVATLAKESAAGLPRSIAAQLADVMSDRAVVVRLTDEHGLTNRDPITFVITAVPDEPPQVAVRLRGISTSVTPTARIPWVGTIADDHGLAAATVTLAAAAPAAEADDPVRELEQPIDRVRPGMAVAEFPADAPETLLLAPLALSVGSRLTITVAATDGCGLEGGPNRGVGDRWTLDVVTPEALQAMLEAREVILRRRYESVIADCSQARDRLAAAEPAGDEMAVAVARLGESIGRAAGETAEIATAFRDIRLELDNNGLLTPEVDMRLITQIADPLAGLAEAHLPPLAAACRGVADPAGARGGLVRQADDVLVRMRALLAMMMELESFNEVIERLRDVIRTQEEIRADTLEQQKKRAREALEGL